MLKYELTRQILSQKEKEYGVRCMDCNKIMTDDPYYFSRHIRDDIWEAICVNCGLKQVETKQK